MRAFPCLIQLVGKVVLLDDMAVLQRMVDCLSYLMVSWYFLGVWMDSGTIFRPRKLFSSILIGPDTKFNIRLTHSSLCPSTTTAATTGGGTANRSSEYVLSALGRARIRVDRLRCHRSQFWKFFWIFFVFICFKHFFYIFSFFSIFFHFFHFLQYFFIFFQYFLYFFWFSLFFFSTLPESILKRVRALSCLAQ